MLEVQDIRTAYGRIEALHGVSRTVRQGEMVTVIGANGAGTQEMGGRGGVLGGRAGVLLLDEPSLGLAPAIVQQLGRIIADLNRDGTTILLVEQNARMALRLANRAYVMATGHIARTGTG